MKKKMRLVMISLDAVARPDADRLLRLPALSALKAEGVYCGNVQTVYPTLTYPIHTSVITGCYPDRHGIAHNQPCQADTAPEMRKWYWDKSDIQVKTLWQAAREKGMDVASVLWPVSGRAGRDIRRNFPEVLPLPGENAALKMIRYGSPVWILLMEALYGKKRKSIRQPDLDDYAALLCEKLIHSVYPPDLLTVHLVDCDAMRHQYGAHSAQAYAAMDRLDGRVNRILQALQKAGLEKDTIVCVLSDHGQEDAQNAFDLNAAIRAALPSAVAQSTGMGAYVFAEDLQAAYAALISHQAQWHVAHIYTEDELRALHAPKNVTLAVDAQAGWRFADGQESGPHIGDHGFSLSHKAAKTLLWLRGGPFKKGFELGQANIVDIAPTLAKALSLNLTGTDGQVLEQAFDTQ